eukprot:818456-Amphidinium_carterae.1
MKMGVFQAALCPKELREHLTLHAHRLESYDQMKEEVRRVRLTRAAIGGAGHAPADSSSPMDIDALMKGKDKGGKTKGKKGDGKKGDGKKGKNKGKPSRFDGECRWCGRKGHMEKDCYYKKEYERKTSGKGSEAPAPVTALEEATDAKDEYVLSIEVQFEECVSPQVCAVDTRVADKTRVMIDSGAAVNACPLSYVESRGHTAEKESGRSFGTANGDYMKGHGASSLCERVAGTATEWPIEVTYETMPVHKLIWSVTRAVDNGWAVWFTSKSAGMCPGRDFTFSVGGEHIPFERRAGVYEARLQDARSGQGSQTQGCEVMPLETEGATG